MNLRITAIVVFALAYHSSSLAQNLETNNDFVKNIDSSLEEGTYKTSEQAIANKLMVTSPDNTIYKDAYTEKEWVKTKNEIKKNQKRIAQYKRPVQTKVIDTIYLNIPTITNNTQISSW